MEGADVTETNDGSFFRKSQIGTQLTSEFDGLGFHLNDYKPRLVWHIRAALIPS